MKERACQRLVWMLLALLAGAAAGVVGWIFWDATAALVLALVGTIWGMTVTHDLARLLCRWRAHSRARKQTSCDDDTPVPKD